MPGCAGWAGKVPGAGGQLQAAAGPLNRIEVAAPVTLGPTRASAASPLMAVTFSGAAARHNGPAGGGPAPVRQEAHRCAMT